MNHMCPICDIPLEIQSGYYYLICNFIKIHNNPHYFSSKDRNYESLFIIINEQAFELINCNNISKLLKLNSSSNIFTSKNMISIDKNIENKLKIILTFS